MQRNNYTLKPWLALGPPPSEPSAKCWFRKHLKRDELSKMNQRKFYTKTLQGKGKEEKKTVDQELAEKHCYKTNRKEDQHFPWSFTEVCVCVCVCMSVWKLLGHVWFFETPWLQLPRFLCPWNSPGKKIRMGSHSHPQGIFLIQGSNWGLSHCRQILYNLSHLGSPYWSDHL